MNRRLVRASMLALALGALAVGIGFGVRGEGAAEAAREPRLAWPAGRVHTYDLQWDVTTEARPLGANRAPTGFRSAIALGGELVLRSYGVVGGAHLLGARFGKLDKASVQAIEKDLLPTAEIAAQTLSGQEAFLELEEGGALRAIRFSPEAPALFRHLMGGVLREAAADLMGGRGDSWKSSGEGPSGNGLVHFARVPGQPRVITRRRDSYDSIAALPKPGDDARQNLVSSGTIELDEKGSIREIHDEETLHVETPGAPFPDLASHTVFAIKKLREEAFDASNVPALGGTVAEVKAGISDEKSVRDMLVQRTQGVTVASIATDLAVHGTAPRVGDGKWAWVASGYLELHPEKCAEIARLVIDEKLDLNGKALAIDLLAGVGHAEAQTALRDALSATRDPLEQGVLLQRLGFVAKPDLATIRFAEATYTTARARHVRPVLHAGAITLGMLANALGSRDRAGARVLADRLVTDLFASEDPKESATLLLAVGNAGFAEDASAIATYATDAAVDVRAAAATAMRKLDGPLVRGTLRTLLGDKDEWVQRAAIASLDRQTLTDQDLVAIEGLVRAGRIAHSNDEALLSFIGSRRGATRAEEILAHIRDDQEVAPATRTRAARILEA